MSERQGLGFVQTFSGYIFSGSTTSATSSIDVSDYYYSTLQPVIQCTGNSTGSITVRSSLDSVNWFNDFVFTGTSTNSSSLTYLTGKRNVIQSLCAITNNSTASLYILSGP